MKVVSYVKGSCSLQTVVVYMVEIVKSLSGGDLSCGGC